MITEQQLSNWTSRAFDNEDEKARNTERMIREAIAGDSMLKTLPIDIYAKGSYKNNTNVRRDSDVDVAVEYTGILYPTYDSETSSELVDRAQGLGPYTGRFRDSAGNTQIGEFKDAVGRALQKAFGVAAVERHNKVFTVREGSRSLAADVVPCATHKHFWAPQRYAQGIRLLPDNSTWPPIDNYPAQHYANGVAKNNRPTHGACELAVAGRPVTQLEGSYYAERGGRGTIRAAERSGVVAGSLGEAEALDFAQRRAP